MGPNGLISAGPRLMRLFRGFGPGWMSGILKVSLEVAYWVMWAITALLLISLVAAVFIPMSAFSDVTFVVGDGAAAREVPLQRAPILFGLGAVAAYFGAFLFILFSLRKIFASLTAGDPFRPENVRRLQAVGLVLAVVTAAVYFAQLIVSRIAPDVVEPQEFGALLTPVFSVLIVFVLAEVFREGARLRRESELTI